MPTYVCYSHRALAHSCALIQPAREASNRGLEMGS
jgi:hypothetical protein